MRDKDLETAYWDSVNQMLNSGLYSSEDEYDLLEEQYRRIDEMARDEVINRLLEDAMKNLPGGGSGSTPSSGGSTSSGRSYNPGRFVNAIVTALEDAAVPVTTALAIAPAIAPQLAVSLGSSATGIGMGPGGVLFAALASLLPTKIASDATKSILDNSLVREEAKGLGDPSSLHIPFTRYSIHDGKVVYSPTAEEREILAKAARDEQISIDEELLPRNFYSYSGKYPRAKSSEGYEAAKKKFRMAKGAELFNKRVNDILAITGGPDPDDDKKKDKVLTEEKLREMAEQALKDADDWFEQTFDLNFKKLTDKKAGKVTTVDYDKYIDNAIEQLEKENQEVLEMARAKAQELARYKSSPEFAKRLEAAANNFLNSNVTGKASPEAKAAYRDYQLRQGEKLIGANNLHSSVAGRGTIAEKSAKALQEARDLVNNVNEFSDLPNLDTSDLNAEEFKRLRDGLQDAVTDMKANGFTGVPNENPGTKQLKIDTAIDILKAKEGK